MPIPASIGSTPNTSPPPYTGSNYYSRMRCLLGWYSSVR